MINMNVLQKQLSRMHLALCVHDACTNVLNRQKISLHLDWYLFLATRMELETVKDCLALPSIDQMQVTRTLLHAASCT